MVGLRVAASCLLIGSLTGVTPAMAAPAPPIPLIQIAGLQPDTAAVLQPGIPAAAAAEPGTPAPKPQDAPSARSGAPSASMRHLSRWVWIAIVAGVGVGVGTAVVLGNRQSAKTAATSPNSVVNVGSGVSAGAPY